jgi:hypothetical protein
MEPPKKEFFEENGYGWHRLKLSPGYWSKENDRKAFTYAAAADCTETQIEAWMNDGKQGRLYTKPEESPDEILRELEKRWKSIEIIRVSPPEKIRKVHS